MSRMAASISSMMRSVSSRLLPGEVCTPTLIVPMSSCGTRPVLVTLISQTSTPHAATMLPTAIALRRNKKDTPRSYFCCTRRNERSKAAWNRSEKPGISPLAASARGRRMSAQSAGLSVMALSSEMATATAIVSPNCV